MSSTDQAHIVKSIDQEQQHMENDILRMGDMAIAQLEAALDVVDRRDNRAAERIIANDEAIDALENEVSMHVMRLATGGPLASDLRIILAALRIASDIERIGDYAANLAKRSLALNMAPPLPLPQVTGLTSLGELVVEQLKDVLRAFRDNDVELAQQVRENDADIDLKYTSLFRELLTYMMEDPRNITPSTHLLFMAKNLERIGDHATNIAENIWFRSQGDVALPPRIKRDESSTTAM